MRFSAAVVAIAVLGTAAPALAQTVASDAPVSTANSTSSSPLTTPQQIERYLATSPAAPDEEAGDGAEPRRIHGEVGVSVGTGDYRSGYAVVSIPLGETGQLDLAYGQTHFGDNAGYVYSGPGYGYGYEASALPGLPMGGRAAGGCLSDFDAGRSIVPDSGGALRTRPERCPAR